MSPNYNKNYYFILNVDKSIDKSLLKKAYYKKSFENHPDKGGNEEIFKEISEAYSILSNEDLKKDYDIKSKWGLNYDESIELLKFEYDNISKTWDEKKYNEFKKNEELNIVVYIDDSFNGNLEYERFVLCKSCKGSGKDTDSKIMIKDEKGNIKYFEGDNGCDYCEGTGKNHNDIDCFYCMGQGKIGLKECKSCKGKKRILGKQKLKVDYPKDKKELMIKNMGNFSLIPGKVGCLWVIKKANF